jgi:hypothetical protein
MSIEEWCKAKTAKSRTLRARSKAKYLSLEQPQVVLATVYSLANYDGEQQMTVDQIAELSGVPYSTTRSIINKLVSFGLMRQKKVKSIRNIYSANVPAIERTVNQLLDE